MKKHIYDQLFGGSKPQIIIGDVINEFYQQKISDLEEKTLFR